VRANLRTPDPRVDNVMTLAHAYDVALSFAGEDRPYADEVAASLHAYGVRVFYDQYQVADLWGRDLYEHLDDVYRRLARFCVLFVSSAYRDKVWTNHERRSAQARALSEDVYVLPVRMDDTEIPGLRETVMYVDARNTGPLEVAQLIRDKLSIAEKPFHVPAQPDRLWHAVQAVDGPVRDRVTRQAADFARHFALLRTEERRVVGALLRDGCHSHLPAFVHADIGALERVLTVERRELLDVVTGLVSAVGFVVHLGHWDGQRVTYTVPPQGQEDATGLYLRWNDTGKTAKDESRTDIAVQMVLLAGYGLGTVEAEEAVLRGDFTQLSADPA
jgi:hypothetical protein